MQINYKKWQESLDYVKNKINDHADKTVILPLKMEVKMMESENQSRETNSIKEQYQKDIGDLTQALLDIQHILKCAPQTTWCDCVLDICREALEGSLHENCDGAPDGGHTAECKAKKI